MQWSDLHIIDVRVLTNVDATASSTLYGDISVSIPQVRRPKYGESKEYAFYRN